MMFSMAIRYDPAADECSEPGLLLPPLLLTPAAATVTMLENCAMRSCRSEISSSRLRHDASVSLRASRSEEEEEAVLAAWERGLLANMAGGGGRDVVEYEGAS